MTTPAPTVNLQKEAPMTQTYDDYSAERRARLSSAGEVAVRVFFNLLPHPASRYAPSAIVERGDLTNVLPDVGPAVRRRQQLRLDAAVGSSARAAAFREALLEAAAASGVERSGLIDEDR